MNIGFFVRHFTERGTEVAIYDYAKYNEILLKNKSFIICFSEQKQKQINFPTVRHSYNKFKSLFEIIEINDITEMSFIIQKYNLSFFYTLTHGCNDVYQFNNKNIWRTCKTIKHCVFDTTCQDSSDYHISISEKLNHKFNTKLDVIPHIVQLPDSNENLRSELNIPIDSFVFGRYGGITEFNINYVHKTIIDHLNNNNNDYFLFMNTNIFYNHPRIIYLNLSLDEIYKTKFINTCDAMIHARDIGETFGLSVAEFSSKNKPVITCNIGDIEHIHILGDKCIVYNSRFELSNILSNIKHITNTKNDWNAYMNYSPINIMNMFDKIFTSYKN
jgi:hypothetical protein